MFLELIFASAPIIMTTRSTIAQGLLYIGFEFFSPHFGQVLAVIEISSLQCLHFISLLFDISHLPL